MSQKISKKMTQSKIRNESVDMVEKLKHNLFLLKDINKIEAQNCIEKLKNLLAEQIPNEFFEGGSLVEEQVDNYGFQKGNPQSIVSFFKNFMENKAFVEKKVSDLPQKEMQEFKAHFLEEVLDGTTDSAKLLDIETFVYSKVIGNHEYVAILMTDEVFAGLAYQIRVNMNNSNYCVTSREMQTFDYCKFADVLEEDFGDGECSNVTVFMDMAHGIRLYL